MLRNYLATIQNNKDVKDEESLTDYLVDVVEQGIEEFPESSLEDAIAKVLVEIKDDVKVPEWQLAIEEICTLVCMGNPLLACRRKPGVVATIGQAMYAYLDEDDTWHDAILEQDLLANAREAVVRFGQWGLVRTLDLESKVRIVEGEEYQKEGRCQMCNHGKNKLTFHHLIPRETHRVVSNQIEKGVVKGYLLEAFKQYAEREGMGEGASWKSLRTLKRFLNGHGIQICGFCHRTVHSTESNLSLAYYYNTLERILPHPSIVVYLTWKKKQ